MKPFIYIFLITLFSLLGCKTAPISFDSVDSGTTLNELDFKYHYSECENQWVVFRKKDDDHYRLAFIYIDPSVGFTLQWHDAFTIDEKGNYRVVGNEWKKKAIFKMRLYGAIAHVAKLPKNRLIELNLKERPKWLEYYKDNSDELTHKIKWGSHYNHAGNSKKALEYLEPAYQNEPHAEGLEFELAYAYNVLKKYDKAIQILELAVDISPNEGLLYKELGYSFFKTERLDEAIIHFKKAYEFDPIGLETYKSEVALSLAMVYPKKNDENNFSNWIIIAKKLAPEGTPIKKYLDQFKIENANKANAVDAKSRAAD